MQIPNDIDDYDDFPEDRLLSEDDYYDPLFDDPDYWYDTNDNSDQIEELFIETICKKCDFWKDQNTYGYCQMLNSLYYGFNGCYEFESMDYNYWEDMRHEQEYELMKRDFESMNFDK